jgi:hypothetical protein
MSGKWGFAVKEATSEEGLIRFVTPGKWVSKKTGSKVLGEEASREK